MNANRMVVAALAVCMALVQACAANGDPLVTGWTDVPMSSRPWCYWWWVNGHVDKPTITADLEAMKRLGFGGLLMFDSRGYWDDERHVVNPKPKMEVMSPEWQECAVFAIREAARLGLSFAMNMSTSGGKMNGPWPVGVDAPKRLVYRYYPAGTPQTAFEKPDLAFYHDIDAQEVFYTGDDLPADGVWRNGGDGVYTMEATSGKRLDGAAAAEPRTLAAPGTPGAKRLLVRFGWAVLPDHEYDVDVLDARAIEGHFGRFHGTLIAQLPGLVGADRTLTHLYSVSWEGTMPTWTGDFENQFRRFTGFDVRPDLPLLAGFRKADAAAHETFLRAYRRARNDMFRENFYGTLARLAHAHGMGLVSESGGPWQRTPAVFREADQLAFLGVNDIPQGEFWPDGKGEGYRARYHVRAAVAAAHLYGRPRASAEAFTHMIRHWSVDPAHLKYAGDRAFAAGVNHLVWHTFTCSPDAFGVPGAEYFAGSHINRNVTWHREAEAFVGYLGRCQWLLQQGQPVEDFAVYAGDRPYQNWGLYREKPYDASKAKLPAGYTYDLVNDAAVLERLALRDGKLVLPSGISYGALVWDPEFPDEPLNPAVVKKVEGWRKAGLPVYSAAEAAQVAARVPPDYAGPFETVHRRAGATDIYFVTGEGAGTMTFRAPVAGRVVEEWNAVDGTRTAARATVRADGRTDVALDLPKGGSRFVLFRPASSAGTRPEAAPAVPLRTLTAPWHVSFAYHRLAAPPPAPTTFETLADWTTRADLRHFAGSATYRTQVELTAEEAEQATTLDLGALPSGLAAVTVNDVDCGVVWCAPWTVAVREAFRAGKNEIAVRYVNNWHNLLIGECGRPEAARLTRSNVRCWARPRQGDPKNPWKLDPTPYSGYCPNDPLQPSGLLGPVRVLR